MWVRTRDSDPRIQFGEQYVWCNILESRQGKNWLPWITYVYCDWTWLVLFLWYREPCRCVLSWQYIILYWTTFQRFPETMYTFFVLAQYNTRSTPYKLYKLLTLNDSTSYFICFFEYFQLNNDISGLSAHAYITYIVTAQFVAFASQNRNLWTAAFESYYFLLISSVSKTRI